MASDLKKVGLVFNADGTTDFIKSLNSVNASLKENYQDFKAVQAQYDENTTSSQKLLDKLDYLNSTYDLQKNKVRVLAEELKSLETSYQLLTKLKKFQFIKNNSLKLNDGRTIQQAISDNNYLRKLKNFYNSIVNNRSTKQRITEVNNSYFECRNLNYDVKEIRNKIEKITQEIETTEFEISKLNSIEFDF